MSGLPPERRPEKAVLMADLKRLGVEFSSLMPGNVLHEMLLDALPDTPTRVVAVTPIVRAEKAEPSARRKVTRRDNRR